MSWSEIDTWIVVTGALISMACAIPGVFLLLNKQSMLGDAISHAVLPGLAAGFLLSGSRDPLPMFLGASLAGLFTGLLTEWIHRRGRVDADASLGVVFCSLFALGLILIRHAADRVDLDPGCVLYGSIETAVVDTGWIPRIAQLSGGMLLANLLLATVFFKELRISAFDPALSTAMGISSRAMRHGLTIVTAITTVVAFESVGSILVIAMLIVPGATALVMSHRLSHALALSLLVAALAAGAGHVAAISVVPQALARATGFLGLGAVSSAGMMAACAGLIFVIVLVVTRLASLRAIMRPEEVAPAPTDTGPAA